jgi:putative addiction module CopG family antidote
MGFALAKEQKQFIDRMVRSGRYNNQSEVVRAALRQLEEKESDYLTPPVLTSAQVERMYADRTEDERERKFGQAAYRAIKRAARKNRCP